MNLYAALVQSLGTFAIVVIIASSGLLAMMAFSGGRRRLRKIAGSQEREVLFAAWAVSVVAMSGSLYLSEIAGLLPCKLCWYQRFAMYPLVLVLGVGFFANYRPIWRFALPLPLIGLPISIYHIFIQLSPESSLSLCSAEVPCTTRYVAVHGFVSIPAMAGAAFLTIATLLLLVRLLSRPTDPERGQSLTAANSDGSNGV